MPYYIVNINETGNVRNKLWCNNPILLSMDKLASVGDQLLIYVKYIAAYKPWAYMKKCCIYLNFI